MDAKQEKTGKARFDVRRGKPVTRRIGGKKVTVTLPDSKTRRGGVSIVVTVEESKGT